MNDKKIAEADHQIMSRENMNISIYDKSVKGLKYNIESKVVDKNGVTIFLFYPDINERRTFIFSSTSSQYNELIK